MLLVKNKNFTEKDEQKLLKAYDDLSNFHENYINSIYDAPKEKREEVIKSFKTNFKKIQKIFEEANCNINVEGI